MPRYSAVLSLNAVRSAALAVSLLAAVTVALFGGDRAWLGRLDAALEEACVVAAHEQLASAAALAGRDPATARSMLEELRATHRGYSLGDRQERVWAVATSLLAQLELGTRHFPRAIELAGEAAQARPQELAFRLQHADILRAAGEAAAADRLVAELLSLLPEHREVAQRALQAAAARGDWLQAGRTLAEHLRHPPALAMDVRYRTAQQDPRALPVQRALLLPRIGADARLAAGFRAPAGALALAVHLPARADFELRAIVLREQRPTEGAVARGGGWAPAAVTGTGIAGDAARAIVSGGESGRDPALVFEREAPLPAAVDLVLGAEIAVRTPDWLLPFLQPEPAAAMVAALLAADEPAAAERIDRHRRLAALASLPVLGTDGPEGCRERPASFRGGWPEVDGTPVALLANLDATVARIRVPWPRPLTGADDPMPRIELEPAAPAEPAVRCDGDTVEVVLRGPCRLRAVRAEGRL